jgi:hypothetical protein
MEAEPRGYIIPDEHGIASPQVGPELVAISRHYLDSHVSRAPRLPDLGGLVAGGAGQRDAAPAVARPA